MSEIKKDPIFFVWMDLEMTGLDDKKCDIIQIATIITDRYLKEIDTLDLVVWQPQSKINNMVPFVKKMHTDNGLLNKVKQSPYSVEDAERKTLDMISRHVPYKKGILAGNSIWQDRRFLRSHMPHLDNFLHYRMLDVSAIKVLSHAWFKDSKMIPPGNSAHTALEDIRASIDEMRFYQKACFREEIFTDTASTRLNR